MNIVTGEELLLLAAPDKARRQLGELMDYLDTADPAKPSVCALYGLRRTGKTTLILQAVKALLARGVDPEAVGYFTGKRWDRFDELYLELEQRGDLQYVFIDEIGFFGGFLSGGSYLYDTLVRLRNQKVVIAGTNLLALHIAAKETLYDRCRIVRVPYLSFYEHCVFVLHKQDPTRDDLMRYMREGGLFAPPGDVADYVQTSITSSIVQLFENEQESDVFVWLRPEAEKVDWRSYVNTILFLSSNYVSSLSLAQPVSTQLDMEALDVPVSKQVAREIKEYFSLSRQDREYRMKRTETVALLDFLVHCGVIHVLPNLYSDDEPYKCYVSAPFLRFHFTEKLRRMAEGEAIKEESALFGALLEATVISEYRESHPEARIAFARTHMPPGAAYVAEIDLLDLDAKRGYEVKLNTARRNKGFELLRDAEELRGYEFELLDASRYVESVYRWGRESYGQPEEPRLDDGLVPGLGR